MVYTRSQVSLLGTSIEGGCVDGESLKGPEGTHRKRKRTISTSSTNSSLDESFGSDSTRSSGSPRMTERRGRKQKCVNADSGKLRRATRLMKYYNHTPKENLEKVEKDSSKIGSPLTLAVVDSDSCALEDQISDSPRSADSSTGRPDSLVSNELISEESCCSEMVESERIDSVKLIHEGSENEENVRRVSRDSDFSEETATEDLQRLRERDQLVKLPGSEEAVTPCHSGNPNEENICAANESEDPFMEKVTKLVAVPRMISPFRNNGSCTSTDTSCNVGCTVHDKASEYYLIKSNPSESNVFVPQSESQGDDTPSESPNRFGEANPDSRGINLALKLEGVSCSLVQQESNQPVRDLTEMDFSAEVVISTTAAESEVVVKNIHVNEDPNSKEIVGKLSYISSDTDTTVEEEMKERKHQTLDVPAELASGINSVSDCEPSLPDPHSDSESTVVTTSESEDTRSPSPGDAKIPVLYSFDDSHDSILEVSSCNSCDEILDSSPPEKSPPVLTSFQNHRSSSTSANKCDNLNPYICPRCKKGYMLLYPYKMHLVRCCPDYAPKGLPLTTVEKRKKIVILSPQYIENSRLIQTVAKKKNPKLDSIFSAKSITQGRSCCTKNGSSTKRKSKSTSGSDSGECKNADKEFRLTRPYNLSPKSSSLPQVLVSKNVGKSPTSSKSVGPLNADADCSLELRRQPDASSEKSQYVGIREITASKQNSVSTQEKIVSTSVQLLTTVEDCSEIGVIESHFNDEVSKQAGLQIDTTRKTEANEGSETSSLNSFFWEVIDHLFLKYVERKCFSATQDQGVHGDFRTIFSSMNLLSEGILSYSVPPVNFTAGYPNETPEENLAHVLIQLELNNPDGMFNKHENSITSGFYNGRRNGWAHNGTVPRFLVEAQESVFKIPTVPLRSKISKSRNILDVQDHIQNTVTQVSKGKPENKSYSTIGKQETLPEGFTGSSIPNRYNNSCMGGRGEKNLKSIEDEYRRSKDAKEKKRNSFFPVEVQHKHSNFDPHEDENIISNFERECRLIVQQLDGPPSPIFADD